MTTLWQGVHSLSSPDIDNLNSNVTVSNASSLPSSSNPINLDVPLLVPFQPAYDPNTHRSFDTPSMKHTTQGSTLIISFSTSHGTFSTNTRINRVAKYFGASLWIYLSHWSVITAQGMRMNGVIPLNACPLSRIVWSSCGRNESHNVVLSCAQRNEWENYTLETDGMYSRTRSNNFLLIHDFCVSPMLVSLHLLYPIHPAHIH